MLIQIYANVKLGKRYMKNDTHEISRNEVFLWNIFKRQNLIVGNSLEFCRGLITREKSPDDNVEKSVIDYVIMCDKMHKFIKTMLI